MELGEKGTPRLSNTHFRFLFCCSSSWTLLWSFKHSSLRSCNIHTNKKTKVLPKSADDDNKYHFNSCQNHYVWDQFTGISPSYLSLDLNMDVNVWGCQHTAKSCMPFCWISVKFWHSSYITDQYSIHCSETFISHHGEHTICGYESVVLSHLKVIQWMYKCIGVKELCPCRL